MALGSAERRATPDWLKAQQKELHSRQVLNLGGEQKRGNPEEAAKKAALQSWGEVQRTRHLLEKMGDSSIRKNLLKELAVFEERVDRTRDDLLPPEALADKQQRRKQAQETARSVNAAPEGTPPITLQRESDEAFLARAQAEAATRQTEIAETDAFIAEMKAKQAARAQGQTIETPPVAEDLPPTPSEPVPKTSERPPVVETAQESKEVRAERALEEVKETWQTIQEMLNTIQDLRRSGAPKADRENALQIRHDLDTRLEREIMAWAQVMQEGTERLSGEVLLQMIAEALNTDEDRLPVLASELDHP